MGTVFGIVYTRSMTLGVGVLSSHVLWTPVFSLRGMWVRYSVRCTEVPGMVLGVGMLSSHVLWTPVFAL